jgi:hypothetical protein
MKTEAELASEAYRSITLKDDGQVQKEDHFSNTFHIYYKELTNIAFHREWNMTKFL